MADSNDDFKKVITRIALKYWYRPETLVVLLVVALLASLYFVTRVKLADVSILEWSVISAALAVVGLVWYWTIRLPTTRKGKIGVVVAITAESEEERRQLQNDFVVNLRRALESSNDILKFHFMELSSHRAASILDEETAKTYVRKCRAHFLIFGDVRVRTINGKEFHALRLRELVVHKQISTELSKTFGREMASIFPEQIAVSRENDLLGLQITSDWLSEAAKYFIAVAALMSGDFDLSQRLFENLRASKRLAELAKIQKIDGVLTLRRLVPGRLADVYGIRSRLEHVLWRQTRAYEHLAAMYDFLTKMHRLRPENYIFNLGTALWQFVGEHDVEKALRTLYECRGSSDATWRYSAAFLEAYRGDLEQATRLYNKAFTRSVQDGVPFEVEEFMAWILENEPDKYQLYYCMGLVNLRAKGDKKRAAIDFGEFIKRADVKLYSRQIHDAERFIRETGEQPELTIQN